MRDVQFHGSNSCRQLCGMSAMRAKASASHAFGSMLLRRAVMMSVIRREVPNRTFNDWDSPPPGFCEVDMVAPGGTSVAGSFIQTMTMADIATGWTECLPLVRRDGSLVVEAMKHAQSRFRWLLRGVDFDNDSTFMNEVVAPRCASRSSG